MSSLADWGKIFEESAVPDLTSQDQQVLNQSVPSPSGWLNCSALAGSPCYN